MDLCLALLPITIVRKLNLALQKKIALGVLLSCGILYVKSLSPLSCLINCDTVLVFVLLLRPRNFLRSPLDLI